VEAGLRLSLELCDSTNAYVSQSPAEIYYAQALAFVLADRRNPRALFYQLVEIASHLADQSDGRKSIDVVGLSALMDAVEHFPLGISHAGDMEGQESDLFDLLARAIVCLEDLSDSISRAFFTHIAPAKFVGFRNHPFVRRQSPRPPSLPAEAKP
jgi:uncharacterized alpha-E superfamily protein